jgi:Tol biopolymer transport system component
MTTLPRLAALLIVAGAARGQVTQLVSVSSSGVWSNNYTFVTGISPDGRYVTFYGDATNLVAVDTNNHKDVFVRDRQLGVTDLVSVSTTGVQGDADSLNGWISSDGRLVVFTSDATNLVAGDTNGFYDAFLRDRDLGTTERIGVGPGGVQADRGTAAGPISADGRFAIIESGATNLTAVPTSGFQVFMRDRTTLTNELVSVSTGGVQGNGPSYGARISADGRFVSFLSLATNLVPGDSNGVLDVFLRDRLLGTTERVDVSTGGAEANAGPHYKFGEAWVSDDGNAVAFTSEATNLVAGDTNSVSDVFVRDRGLATTVRVSVDSQGVQGDNRSTGASISGDGNRVVFTSYATNLVPDDTNGFDDCFLHDRLLGTTERVSVGYGGTEANYSSLTFAAP